MQVKFQGLTKSFTDKTIFRNLSGIITKGDRIGLVGANGAGKTTLAKIIAGIERADEGQIVLQPVWGKIAYAEQLEEFQAGCTVFAEVQAEAGTSPERVYLVLEKMGLPQGLWQREARRLSGGEKTKLSLCKVMVQEFDLLILDEPTNHLDLDSLGVLEEYLLSLNKPQLVISHDRFFLDRIATCIWELTTSGLKSYPGNYTAYRQQKAIELKEQNREYEKQQRRIAELKEEIHRRSSWYNGAHKAAGQNDFYRSKAKKHAQRSKAKKRELARLEANKIRKPQREVSPAFEIINKQLLNLRLPKFLIKAKSLSKSYGDQNVFQNLSFDLCRGDKVALIGPNGSGKTTFLKIIAGQESYDGTIEISPQVRIGYFSQELTDLDPNRTILEEVAASCDLGEARLLLACLLFRGDAVEKKIASLSMGEKARVAFAKLVLSGANLLLLDEPTNYLDINSREKMEEVLADFQGSLLFVSHDRYFIDKLAQKIAVLANSTLEVFPGNYSDYLARQKEQVEESCRDLEAEINLLECRLAFLGGRLATCTEEEKEQLDEEYRFTLAKLQRCRALLSGK